MDANINSVVLRNLLNNDKYVRAVLPHLKEEYFSGSYHRIFQAYSTLFEQYNTIPTPEAIALSIEMQSGIGQEEFDDINKILVHHKNEEDHNNYEWLLDETEKFCQERALYNAISQSISIMDDEDQKLDKGSIPQLLQEALGVSFDSSIGHSYFEDADARFEFYNRKEERIPFNLKMFDKVTKGGLPRKTLNVFLGGTGVGKSLVLCHLAASYMLQGLNVLYITLEMAEERIAERIDANLLEIDIDDLRTVDHATYIKTVNAIKKRSTGNIIIKEYPTASAHVGHFRHLVQELRMKKNFVPNVILIDYLNICTSSRVRGSNINSYTMIKSIAEEMRGFAVECNVPILSATQTNRDGLNSSDLEMNNTSESIGLPATVDSFYALIATDDLSSRGLMMIKQLKSRYSDIVQDNKFLIGVDKARMRLYDVEDSAMATQVATKVSADATPHFGQEVPNFGTGSTAKKFDTFQF